MGCGSVVAVCAAFGLDAREEQLPKGLGELSAVCLLICLLDTSSSTFTGVSKAIF